MGYYDFRERGEMIVTSNWKNQAEKFISLIRRGASVRT